MLYYPNSLEAYRSDKFEPFATQPKVGGVITEQNGAWGYYSATPVGSAGSATDGGCQVLVQGKTVVDITVGDAVQFNAHGIELPVADRLPATTSTFYDLASISKLFTAVTALSLVADGDLALDEPTGRILRQYRSGPKSKVTLRHLLSHTSGLASEWLGWRSGVAEHPHFDRDQLLANLLDAQLEAEPGSRNAYSCFGYNTVMALCESRTAKPWASLVQERVLAKLPTSGLTATPLVDNCAATEFQPEYYRGMIRGIVSDEAAWSLTAKAAGPAGNSGMFATANGLSVFAEALRHGLPGILPRELADEMHRDQLADILGPSSTSELGFGQGLGPQIGQPEWMSVFGHQAFGHSGFTGTSLLVDQSVELSIVLLTNRVHPGRNGPEMRPLRNAVSQAVYASLATA